MQNLLEKLEPAIYVGTWEKYNNGSLAGAWLKLQDYKDAEEFYKKCKDLHSDEVDPEFMFQDIENMPTGFSKNEDVKEAYEKLEVIDSIELDAEIITAGIECEIEPDEIEECYAGSYNSDIDFAVELADSCGFEEPTSWPNNCIDWERAARDLMFDYREHNGHYFRNI